MEDTVTHNYMAQVSSGARTFGQWVSSSTRTSHSVPVDADAQETFSRRKKVWQFIEDRHSGFLATLYYFVITSLIGTSVILSVLDLVSAHDEPYRYVLKGLEALLAVELVVRFCVCPNQHVFWIDWYNIIDVFVCACNTVPLLVSTFADIEPSLAYSIRVFMPLTLSLRYLRRFEHFHLLVFAFKDVVQALPVLLYTLLLIAFFHAALIYLLEPRDVHPTLADALWFTMTTMSTVGYATAPATAEGKAAALTLSVVSALYLAIPIGIMGTAFSKVWEDRERLVLMQQMRRRISRAGLTPYDLIRMFRKLDQDQNLSLTFEEFKEFLPMISVSMPDAVALRIFETLDYDGEGSISFEEFLLGMFPAHHFYMTAIYRQPRRAQAQGRKAVADEQG